MKTNELSNKKRLEALAETGLLDSLPEESFDRLTRLVQKLLDVPVSLMSLVDDKRQFFKSALGLPEPWASLRGTPLSHSFCQHVVTEKQALKVSDSRLHPVLKDNLAIADLNVIAYLGIPLKTPNQQIIGSLCAIDAKPRDWTDNEQSILSDIAEIAMSEIAMRQTLKEKEALSQELSQGSGRLRSLINNLYVFVGLLTPEGILIEANKPALQAANLKEADVIGKAFEETYWWSYSSESKKQLRKSLRKAKAGEISRFHAPIRLAEKQFITIDFMVAPIFDEAGKVSYLVPSGIDITEQLHNEAKLREQSQIVNLAYDAIILWSKGEGISSWSQGASNLYGFSEEEALGKISHELLKTKHPISLAKLESTLLEKDHWEGELIQETKSGEQVIVSTRHQLIDPESFLVLEINRDISEQKRVEEALVQLNEDLEMRVQERTLALERSLEELNQFTYVASHDLKAPLRAIDNLANWIEEDAAQHLPEASKRHLKLMKGRILRLERLLEDLLAYSRADRTSYPVEAFDLGELLNSIIDMLNPPESFRITIDSEVGTIQTTRVPLETVIRNLINNAVKHHDRDNGKIAISARHEDDFLSIEVKDDGPGIEPSYFDKIFMIFQTLQPRDKVESSGVGLAIVKKLVESHNGEIEVSSAPGKGASFKFSWLLNNSR